MVTSSIINRLSRAIDQIEKRSEPPRPFKVVEIYCGYGEDMDVARARHYAAHPEDRDADVVIRRFCSPADEGRNQGA
jgi:hypothetical protein